MSTDVLYPVLIGVGCLLVVIVVHVLTRKRPSQSDINVPAAGTPDHDASQAPALALAAWHRRHEGSVLDFIEHHDEQMAWADAEPATDDEDQAGNGDDADEVAAGDSGDEPANAGRDDGQDNADDDTTGDADDADDVDDVDDDPNTEGDNTDEVEAESTGIEADDVEADVANSAAGSADEADEDEAENKARENGASENGASENGASENDDEHDDEHDVTQNDNENVGVDDADENEASDDEAEPASIGDDHDPEGVGAALEAAADAHPGPDMRAELAAMRAAAEAAHLARGRDDGDAALRHRGVYAGYRGAWLERLQQFGVDNDRIGRLRRRNFPADLS